MNNLRVTAIGFILYCNANPAQRSIAKALQGQKRYRDQKRYSVL